MFKQLQAHAPCYTSLKDDGASFKCACCNNMFNHNQVRYCFLPNHHNIIQCLDCMDDEWKDTAKDFSHIRL